LLVEEGRYLASRIPNATFVELPGKDHLPFVGDQDAILDEIERFLSQTHAPAESEEVLTTVLTVESDAGPADREHVRRVFEREVTAHRGRIIAAREQRLVAAFDGPGRAVRCGGSVIIVAERSKIPLKAGVHIGECDLVAPAGPLLDLTAKIAATADVGEVLVSRTVVDLVPGSGLDFIERSAIQVPGAHRELPVLMLLRA